MQSMDQSPLLARLAKVPRADREFGHLEKHQIAWHKYRRLAYAFNPIVLSSPFCRVWLIVKLFLGGG